MPPAGETENAPRGKTEGALACHSRQREHGEAAERPDQEVQVVRLVIDQQHLPRSDLHRWMVTTNLAGVSTDIALSANDPCTPHSDDDEVPVSPDAGMRHDICSLYPSLSRDHVFFVTLMRPNR